MKAVLLDIDGTLVDSVDLHALAWQEAFQYFGKDVPFEDVRSQIGKGGDQLIPVFFTKEEIHEFGEELTKYRSEHFKRNYLPRVKGFPCSREFVQRLQKEGITVVLASSAKGDELEAYKRAADITDLIDDETSADDAKETKPEPDIFEAALKKAGNPNREEVVVIGDSPFDAIAAKKAGVHAIGVLLGGFSAEELRTAGCEAVYKDLRELIKKFDYTILHTATPRYAPYLTSQHSSNTAQPRGM